MQGIYAIRNIHTGRVYIGASTYFSTRWSSHKCDLRGGRHANKLLQADWNHYGEESFLFEVVEKISMGYYPLQPDERRRLLAAERAWIHHHKDCIYNLLIGNKVTAIRLSDNDRAWAVNWLNEQADTMDNELNARTLRQIAQQLAPDTTLNNE